MCPLSPQVIHGGDAVAELKRALPLSLTPAPPTVIHGGDAVAELKLRLEQFRHALGERVIHGGDAVAELKLRHARQEIIEGKASSTAATLWPN